MSGFLRRAMCGRFVFGADGPLFRLGGRLGRGFFLLQVFRRLDDGRDGSSHLFSTLAVKAAGMFDDGG